jgi:hypothetical protein
MLRCPSVLILLALLSWSCSGADTTSPDSAPALPTEPFLYRLNVDLVNRSASVQPLSERTHGMELHALLGGSAISVSTPTSFSKPGDFGAFQILATISNNTSLFLGTDQNARTVQGIRTVFTSLAASPSGSARLSNADGYLTAGPFITTPFSVLTSTVQTWGFEASTGATSISATFYITADTQIPTPPQSGSVFVERLAGDVFAGFNDGDAADARFSSPLGIAYDAFGGLYVADFGNNAIRVISPIGNLVRTLTFLSTPHDVAVGPNDDVYVVSFAQGKVYHIFGVSSPFFGVTTEIISGLAQPTGISVDAGGSLYIAEFGTSRILRFLRFSQAAANNPGAYAPAFVIGFVNGPDGIAWDRASNSVFVASRSDTDIVQLLARGGGELSRRDTGNTPLGLDTDTAGGVFFAEGSNLLGVTVAGAVVPVSINPFLSARGVAVRSDGTVAVSDAHRVSLVHRRIESP